MPGPIAARLASLASEASVCLLIREADNTKEFAPTQWVRMKSGRDGRPTHGIRITGGVEFFESIPLGTEIHIVLQGATVVSADSAGAATPSPPGRALSVDPIPARLQRTGQRRLFQAYLIADYSGNDDLAGQRRAIKVAVCEGYGIRIVPVPFTRTSLVRDLVTRLAEYTRHGIRAVVGIDHQYSLPMPFAETIGLGGLTWRDALARLYSGDYGIHDRKGPRWGHPRQFASAFNDFLRFNEQQEYFWSATKHEKYNLRNDKNPRSRRWDRSVYRLTELCRGFGSSVAPKPLSRLGDKGSVGNQSCCGMGHLLELLDTCKMAQVPIAVWPMDGIDIESTAYEGKHVMVEPYPSAKRKKSVRQTDENDATASVEFLLDKDQRGELPRVCDLSSLTPEEVRIVEFEGWILSHVPWNRPDL